MTGQRKRLALLGALLLGQADLRARRVGCRAGSEVSETFLRRTCACYASLWGDRHCRVS